MAKRTGSNAFLDCIVLFKFSSDSKPEQIFALLNSDDSAGMAKQKFARRWIASWHDYLNFYFDVHRGAVAGYDKSPPQPDIPAIAHGGMLSPVAPMKDDREDQPKTSTSPSLDPRTILCVYGPLRRDC